LTLRITLGLLTSIGSCAYRLDFFSKSKLFHGNTRKMHYSGQCMSLKFVDVPTRRSLKSQIIGGEMGRVQHHARCVRPVSLLKTLSSNHVSFNCFFKPSRYMFADRKSFNKQKVKMLILSWGNIYLITIKVTLFTIKQNIN
jgi:hypothetical protein